MWCYQQFFTFDCHCEERQRRSNLSLEAEIAALPLVARNDHSRGIQMLRDLCNTTLEPISKLRHTPKAFGISSDFNVLHKQFVIL
jgi:hypothetical protein